MHSRLATCTASALQTAAEPAEALLIHVKLMFAFGKLLTLYSEDHDISEDPIGHPTKLPHCAQSHVQ